MKTYYSLSQFPGSTGKYYYTYFFNRYNIDAIYSPEGCDPNDFSAVFNRLIQQVSTQGISISMPFKSMVIEYCDIHDSSVTIYNSCNTVTKKGYNLFSYNCDLAGVIGLCSKLDKTSNITILGDGCMGKMFSRYLLDNKYSKVDIFSRRHNNWESRHKDSDIIINCTSYGTASSESPLKRIPDKVRCIIDLSIGDNELKCQASTNNIAYINGLEFYMHQFIQQFKIYTGVDITIEEFKEASRLR